jgi:hypothetical protein
MPRPCFACERPVTRAITLVRASTGERLRLHRACCIRLINGADARTRAGVRAAILRGARS